MNAFHFRKGALALTACIAMLVSAATAQAQDIKERHLKFAFSLPKDHPIGVGAQKFSDLVNERSGGKIKIALFPNAVLGGDPQNLSALRGGTLDFTSMATGLLAGVDKQFMVFDFPFLFNNAQEAYALSDGPVGQRLLSGLSNYGLVGLGIWDLGFRNMTNSRRPITKAEDLQGLKMRVIASPIYVDMFSTLGANPVPMTFGEVYGALESQAIDGQDNPVGVIESAKFAEVQKYLSLTRHVYTGMPFLMSKKTWDAMSADEHKIIMDAANDAKEAERELSQATELQAIAELRKSMQVNEVTEPEVVRLREKVAPVVAKFAHEVGDTTMTQVNAELSKMRAGK